MASSNYICLIFPCVTIALILIYFFRYASLIRPVPGTTEWVAMKSKSEELRAERRYPMLHADKLILCLLVLIYSAVAFTNLGSTTDPQTFYKFAKAGDSITITLDSDTEIGSVMYYTGLTPGVYNLAFSDDGTTWKYQGNNGNSHGMEQSYADLFKWLYANLNDGTQTAKYIRITADTDGMQLGELAIYDTSGSLITANDITCETGTLVLFDEPDVIPEEPYYMNSMIFDEIYHGRAAYEFNTGVYPFETTHPPLGKLIIAAFTAVLGMTPLGWRFAGTLFGVAMLPLMYVFLKNLFGKTSVSVCGTLLFAFDFMHYTQTRIATIDTYSVFFIILMYFFMYRYMTTDYDAPFKKTTVPLLLCGLSFGLGAACKWTSIYAGAGLAVLYVIHMFRKYRYHASNGDKKAFWPYFGKTIPLSVVFFIIIPALIYYLSYIPYGLDSGMKISEGMLWSKEYAKLVWDNQVFMYTYHSTLVATHSYSSKWYEWMFDIRPILYYLNYADNNSMRACIGAFGNPMIWWGGLAAMAAMVFQSIKNKDKKALFILIGYLSQLMPWMLVPRLTFIYHYFPSTVFLVLAIAHTFNTLIDRKRGNYKLLIYGFTSVTILLFIMFYPVLTGLWVSSWYSNNILGWLPRWPF